MPELPEVETIVRQLKQQIVHKVIKRVEILRPDQWHQNPPEQMQNVLVGQQVKDVARRAKFILIEFHTGARLIIHLRMTGKLMWSADKPVLDNFTRTIFYFTDGSCVQFSDTRALGWLIYLNSDQQYPALDKLGVEPLSDSWQLEHFASLCRKSSLAMKSFLMDQNKIAGIGNIYANEILFRAGIHPERRVNSLSDSEIERLFYWIPRVLDLAVQKMGTTLGNRVSDYRSVFNMEGQFQSILMVYGREGQQCFKCGSPIIRIKQKDRSSFVCENCQH